MAGDSHTDDPKRDNPFSYRPPKELGGLDALRAKAEDAGLSVGGYITQAIFSAAPLPRSRVPHPNKQELARLLAETGRIGNNINQLARLANAGSWPDSDAINETRADIRWMRTTLMHALGVSDTAPAAHQDPEP